MGSFRRRLMMAQGGGGSSVPGVKESEAGDICVYDVNKGSLAIIKAAEWSASKYPIATYVPVGIVAVPASHNHYEGGKCAIISLNHMNCDTPQTGGNYQFIYWGEETDISSLPNLDKTPYVGSNGNVGENVIGETDESFLPTDDPTGNTVNNPYDNKTNYKFNDEKYSPSPYNNDGTFNTEYSRITSPSSTANCLADFDGYNNTKKILEVRGERDYNSWKPNESTLSDYPAASCCDMYYTVGTNQGDWYLPSAGELGYVAVRSRTINSSINKLIENGLNNSYAIAYDDLHCSSSESSNLHIVAISANIGQIARCDKYSGGYIRAFTLV